MSKEEKIVDWVISALVYSLAFLILTQCGLAFFLVGIYVSYYSWIYLLIGAVLWMVAVITLAVIRKKLKSELKQLK